MTRFSNSACLKVNFWQPNKHFRWPYFSTQIFNTYFNLNIFKIFYKLYRASSIKNTTLLSCFWKFMLIFVAKNLRKETFFVFLHFSASFDNYMYSKIWYDFEKSRRMAILRNLRSVAKKITHFKCFCVIFHAATA